MDKCLVLAALLVYAQAGPYVWRPRPVAKPLVDSAQWYVHQQLLLTEQRALQHSLDVSRLAQRTTAEAYRRHRRALVRIKELERSLAEEVKEIEAHEPKCVGDRELEKSLAYLRNATKEIFQCTHGLGDAAAGLEVAMAERVTAARAQIWDVQQAMWFCQKFTDKEDEECLRRLVREGLEAVGRLPARARMLVDRAAGERTQAGGRMAGCAARALSAAAERRHAHAHAMRECVRQAGGMGRDT